MPLSRPMANRGLNKSRRTGRPKPPIVLSPEERRTLSSWSRLSGKTPPEVGRRARIILMAARGETGVEIARLLRVSPQTVCKWRDRFLENRLDGLSSTREVRPRKSAGQQGAVENPR